MGREVGSKDRYVLQVQCACTCRVEQYIAVKCTCIKLILMLAMVQTDVTLLTSNDSLVLMMPLEAPVMTVATLCCLLLVVPAMMLVSTCCLLQPSDPV